MAAHYFYPTAKVFGAEPILANDASLSYQKQQLVRLTSFPNNTIAEGARALSLSQRTFEYIKKTSGIFEISENEIGYWTARVNHMVGIKCEPTAALSMAAAARWLNQQERKSRVVVIISGGNG